MATTTSSRHGRRACPDPAAPISTYSRAVRFLRDRVNYERMRVIRFDAGSFKLDRMETLLEALGNPQEHVRMVHVAGTVGKGSTVAMIASMLEGCGYAVGQFTGPSCGGCRTLSAERARRLHVGGGRAAPRHPG